MQVIEPEPDRLAAACCVRVPLVDIVAEPFSVIAGDAINVDELATLAATVMSVRPFIFIRLPDVIAEPHTSVADAGNIDEPTAETEADDDKEAEPLIVADGVAVSVADAANVEAPVVRRVAAAATAAVTSRAITPFPIRRPSQVNVDDVVSDPPASWVAVAAAAKEAEPVNAHWPTIVAVAELMNEPETASGADANFSLVALAESETAVTKEAEPEIYSSAIEYHVQFTVSEAAPFAILIPAPSIDAETSKLAAPGTTRVPAVSIVAVPVIDAEP